MPTPSERLSSPQLRSEILLLHDEGLSLEQITLIVFTHRTAILPESSKWFRELNDEGIRPMAEWYRAVRQAVWDVIRFHSGIDAQIPEKSE